MRCHLLLQGIFLTHELNLSLLCCGEILYCLSPPREAQTEQEKDFCFTMVLNTFLKPELTSLLLQIQPPNINLPRT